MPPVRGVNPVLAGVVDLTDTRVVCQEHTLDMQSSRVYPADAADRTRPSTVAHPVSPGTTRRFEPPNATPAALIMLRSVVRFHLAPQIGVQAFCTLTSNFVDEAAALLQPYLPVMTRF